MTFAPVLSLIWIAWIWWKVARTARFWVLFPAALVAALLGEPGIWQSAFAGYPGDSFWTLQNVGRLGVLAISTIGFIFVFALVAIKTRWFKRLPCPVGFPLDVVAGLAIYIGLYAISPQIYYSFYQLIFPDLPQQIVIHRPDLESIATLRAGGTMSDHLAGVGLWAVLPFTLWQYRR